MAKPLLEISKTEFNKNYNVVKVFTTKMDIMNFVKTQYQDSKDNAIAFAVRKSHRVTLEDIMNEVIKHRVTLEDIMNEVIKHRVTLEDIMFEIKGIKNRLDNLEDRLTQIVQANNLVDPTQKTK